MRIADLFSRLVTALVWVLVVALIAVGGGGIAGTINHIAGTPARAELTAPGDTEVTPLLDGATTDLQAVADAVDTLSGSARTCLAMLLSGDQEALGTAIADGTNQLTVVKDQAAILEAALAEVPHMGVDAGLHVRADLEERYGQLVDTTVLTDGLEEDWATLTGQALDASQVSGLLERHDQETAQAASAGTAAKYAKALRLLDAPDATIATLREIAARLAKRADISTLTAWVDRNAAYDTSLRALYTALNESKGVVTAAVRKAIDAEKVARAALPESTKGILVIMSDIAQGGLNQALISIETARGQLSDALDTQRALQEQDAAIP